MKQVFAIGFCVFLLITLTACHRVLHSTTPTDTNPPDSNPTQIQPNKPDLTLLQQYVDIIRFLYSRHGPSHDSVYINHQAYYDQGALIASREWLLEHDEVDQWFEFITGYWGDDCNWDRLAALELFTCLEDVAITDDRAQYNASDPVYFF